MQYKIIDIEPVGILRYRYRYPLQNTVYQVLFEVRSLLG